MTNVLFFLAVFFAAFVSFGGSNQAHATRLIQAAVSYDGVFILEGSLGDNGKADADGRAAG
jgi:hypothetical protein